MYLASEYVGICKAGFKTIAPVACQHRADAYLHVAFSIELRGLKGVVLSCGGVGDIARGIELRMMQMGCSITVPCNARQ